MKPCKSRKSEIAALTTGHLDEVAAHRLREHLANCSGCREYHRELRRVAEILRPVDLPPRVEPSPYLHRRIVSAVHEADAGSLGRVVRELRGLRLGPALTGLAVVGIGLGIAFRFWPPPPNGHATPPARGIGANVVAQAERTPDPTFGRYLIVAGHSLDRLDQLLATDGNESRVATPPTYTAAMTGPVSSRD